MNVLALGLFLTLTGDPTVEPDRIVHAKKTVIEFSELKLSGTVVGPEGCYLDARKKAKFRTFLRLRNSFRSELESSVDRI